jgi:hypothetical protein
MIVQAEHQGELVASDAAEGTLLTAARDAREKRRRRDQVFGGALLAEPCWDLLLDLFIATQEGRRLSITAACLALPVPRGTAERCIAHLADVGLISRETKPGDHGVVYLAPTDQSIAKLSILLGRPGRDEGAASAA